MEELRQVPLYRATTRTLMVLGAERELTLILMIFSAAVVFTSLSIEMTVVGSFTWFTGLFLLRQLAKHDPQISRIFLRYWVRHREKFLCRRSAPVERRLPAGKKNETQAPEIKSPGVAGSDELRQRNRVRYRALQGWIAAGWLPLPRRRPGRAD